MEGGFRSLVRLGELFCPPFPPPPQFPVIHSLSIKINALDASHDNGHHDVASEYFITASFHFHNLLLRT